MRHDQVLQHRPEPEDALLQAAWRHSGMRYDVLFGDWKHHADTRLHELFNDEALMYLPPADTSGNPARSIVGQLSTLYDKQPMVEVFAAESGAALDADAIAPLVQPWSWSMMQDVLESVVGINDCAVFTGISGGELYTKVARPHEYVEVPDPENPDQPIEIRHLELSMRPGTEGAPRIEWTWTTWHKTDPARFKVEAVIPDRPGAVEDVTRAYYPEVPEGKAPYMRADGTVIWPWVLYHRRVANMTRSTYPGRELFDGTLTHAALRTMLLQGARDGAMPLRYVLDGKVVHAGTTDAGSIGNRDVQANPMVVLQLQSIGDQKATPGEWGPMMDPKPFAEMVAAFGAELGVYAGLSGNDIRLTGGGGSSGYAIALSREGQRRMRQRVSVPMSEGDRLRLSQGAALLNAYTSGPALPEDPDLYKIDYADLPRSLEEVKADLERADRLRDAGVLGRVDHFMQFNPGVDREKALSLIVRNAIEEAQIASMVREERARLGLEDPDSPPGDVTPDDNPE